MNEPSQVSSCYPDVSVIMWQRICQLTYELPIVTVTQHHDLIVFSIQVIMSPISAKLTSCWVKLSVNCPTDLTLFQFPELNSNNRESF